MVGYWMISIGVNDLLSLALRYKATDKMSGAFKGALTGGHFHARAWVYVVQVI